MSGSETEGRPERTVYLDESAFELKSHAAGSPAAVATAQVPNSQVWRVPVGEPLVVALVAKQTVTVASAATDSTKQLNPAAPVVDYLGDVSEGDYSTDSNVVAYYDSDGGGSKDTLVTDTSGVSYSGTFGGSDDFIQSVDFDGDGTADREVAIYTVVRHGYAQLRKRSSGKSNVRQELQTEDAITWAFSNPDSPDADRQITWETSNRGLKGVLPPKFYLDVVYYDNDYSAALDAAEASDSQLELSIPMGQRPLRNDEDPAALRRKVAQNMAGT
jgi:hypothetical protein